MPEPILAGNEIQKSLPKPLDDRSLKDLHDNLIYATSVAAFLRHNRTSDPAALLEKQKHLRSFLLAIALGL